MNNEELKELAAVLNGIADGKKWQILKDGEWYNASGSPLGSIGWGRKIRLKQWHLPDPPHGYEWHRNDWTEEMLPDGWRPLLLGEFRESEDQYLRSGCEWVTSGGVMSLCSFHYHSRTRRPFPPPKPQLREVPLCAEDVKAGDEFLSPDGIRRQWQRISFDGVSFFGTPHRWNELMELGWKIRSVGETEWRKCSKQEEVPA